MTEKEKQHELAAVIKGVHSKLRKRYKSDKDNFDKAWIDHCKNEELLSQYADAMHELATNIWASNNTETRIDWCKAICREFFHNGGLEKALAKDKRRQKFEESVHKPSENWIPDISEKVMQESVSVTENIFSESQEVHLPLTEKIHLLDVGSCYNPFKGDPDFTPVAVDLSPAVKSVLRCDFLKLEITDSLTKPLDIETLTEPVTSLPANAFHVVVFSLLLEYLPSVHLRWLCCQKAHKLLELHGLFIVITPDSNHQNKNAPMMKRWKAAIESLGFSRWRYVKQEHLHCMAFRKTQQVHDETLEGVGEMLTIPQDFSDASENEETNVPQNAQSNCDKLHFEDFGDLPFCGDFDL